MKARIGVVAGLLLVGAAAWAQSPAERAEDIARLKVRVELAELTRDMDREFLKESMLLLRRTERDLSHEGQRSDVDEKTRAYRLDRIRDVVASERKQFEEQGVALEALRRELRQAQAPQPVTPVQAAPRPAAAEESLDDLEGRAAIAEMNVKLLSAQLILMDGSLSEQLSKLAALEVRGADPQNKDDQPLKTELQAATKRFGEVRDRYVELKKKLAVEQRTLLDLHQQRAGMLRGGGQ